MEQTTENETGRSVVRPARRERGRHPFADFCRGHAGRARRIRWSKEKWIALKRNLPARTEDTGPAIGGWTMVERVPLLSSGES